MRLAEPEARRRLAGVPVVRLATADELGRPHVVAMTFVAVADVIFSAVDAKPKRSRDLRRLRNIRVNPAVSVLADHYEDDWTRLWWVRADGTATVLDTEDAMAHPLRLLGQKYRQYRADRPGGPVIAITVTRWTGWSSAHGG